MPNPKLPLVSFILIALIQISVPVWMIGEREMTLHYGKEYRFKVAPVDPYDFFRGYYVALSLQNTTVKPPTHFTPRKGQNLYIALKIDPQGFASFAQAFESPPEGQEAYLKLRVAAVQEDKLEFVLPFDRFYLEETLAPETEQAFRELNPTAQSAHIVIRVHGGKGVIEALFLDNLPVKAYLAQRRKTTTTTN